MKTLNENFQDYKLIKPSSSFEKLPKNILSIIFSYFDVSEITKMWRLNKYFFTLICNSTFSTTVWKTICERNFESENLKDIVEQNIKSLEITEFEKNLNEYCILFKYFQIEWDPEIT